MSAPPRDGGAEVQPDGGMQYGDIPEWVSEIRRLYVEPKSRRERRTTSTRPPRAAGADAVEAGIAGAPMAPPTHPATSTAPSPEPLARRPEPRWGRRGNGVEDPAAHDTPAVNGHVVEAGAGLGAARNGAALTGATRNGSASAGVHGHPEAEPHPWSDLPPVDPSPVEVPRSSRRSEAGRTRRADDAPPTPGVLTSLPPEERQGTRAAAREVARREEVARRGRRRRVAAVALVLLVVAVAATWWMTRGSAPLTAWLPDAPRTAALWVGDLDLPGAATATG